MNHIIACIDGSSSSASVCDAAAWAANKVGAPLILLHTLEKSVVPEYEDFSGTLSLGGREQLLNELTELDEQRSKLALNHGKLLLEEARKRAVEDGVSETSIRIKQRHGDVLDSLIDLEPEARFFVMGRSGEGHEKRPQAVGSHIESVVRTVTCPLLITVGEFKVPKSFMIAYDGRETADKALERIAGSELLQDVPCHLVMVGEETEERQAKLANARRILTDRGFAVEASIIQGEIFKVLQTYRDEHGIELVALGAYGHSRVRQFFVGSNTTRMISDSPVPLLIMK